MSYLSINAIDLGAEVKVRSFVSIGRRIVCLVLVVAGLLLGGCDADEKNSASSGEAVITANRANAPTNQGNESQANKGEFKYVDLGQLIDQEIDAYKEIGHKKLIKSSEPIWFEAVMKQGPKAKKMAYVYTALQVAQVHPLPEVGHQMFLEARDDRVISVYVEKEIAEKIQITLHNEDDVQWLGYHVYTYAKGPAILVVDFISTNKKGAGSETVTSE